MSRFPRSRGFTLVELLVVIAIIGTLVALLLPAVQQGREAARRMSCSNNLRNLQLATQQYHDSIGQYPSAWITWTVYNGPGKAPTMTSQGECWGWGALILPWLEQRNLYNALQVTKYQFGEQFRDTSKQGPSWSPSLWQTPLKIFICPSDTGYNGNHLSPRQFNLNGNPMDVAVSNYIANEGHHAFDRWVDGSGVRQNTGVMWGDSYCRMADIVDGTSNTIMFGERESLVGKSAVWVGVDEPKSSGAGGVSVAVAHAITKLNQQDNSQNPNNPAWSDDYVGPSEGFSSLHPNGMQFAFCDGSVRWINNQIPHNWFGCPSQGCGTPQVGGYPGFPGDEKYQGQGTFQRLMSRADRLTINADF